MLYIIVLILVALTAFSVYHKVNTAVCTSNRRLEGKTAVVTGGTSGLGLVIAKDFAKRGAKVIVACPFEEEGTNARQQIIRESGNENVLFKYLDLSSLTSVREFVKEIQKTENRLDILVNNAGVGIPGDFLTKDGLNFIMQVNYYGHFLLTILLLPLLKKTGTKSDPARIVNMSSLAHRYASSDVDNYNRAGYWLTIRTYCNSKLCLVFFSKELTRRLSDTNVVVNCSDPGYAATRIYNSANEFLGFLAITFILLFANTAFQGAQTAIYLGVDEAVKGSGEYFKNCKQIAAASKANNETSIRKLWEQSLRLVKLSVEELRELNFL
ncbi:retinol dehydrogenase 13-like [Pieris brassicae]|uniref:retinol dehydrogenase 13-like n=1 Tax=Pieris brassicae TaxID=7116 RepID=UPI001E66151D|nr:retinol dehydrogenase 13-like [Pieris brassicae]